MLKTLYWMKESRLSLLSLSRCLYSTNWLFVELLNKCCCVVVGLWWRWCWCFVAILLYFRHWTVMMKTVRPRAPSRRVSPEKNAIDGIQTAPRMWPWYSFQSRVPPSKSGDSSGEMTRMCLTRRALPLLFLGLVLSSSSSKSMLLLPSLFFPFLFLLPSPGS